MPSFLEIPVLARVLASLLAIIVLSRFFKTLFFPLFAGTAVLALWIGYSPLAAARLVADKFVSPGTILLMLVIIQILYLSALMSHTGSMRTVVDLIKARLSRGKAMAVLPAIVGFLPMPGGAIFSAPLVDDCDEGRSIDPMLKTQMNYWFRHIWEYWWPLYPGVILANQLSTLETWQFMLLQIPMSFASVAIGYFFFLSKVPSEDHAEKHPFDKASALALAKLLSPIIAILVVYALARIFLPKLSEASKFAPMAVALVAALATLQIQRPAGLGVWKKIVFDKSVFVMVGLVLLVVAYGAFIEGRMPDGTPVVGRISGEITEFGIPRVVLMMLVPFICGMTTGVAFGFVGASFPVVMGLLGENPTMGMLLSTVFMAYGFGYVGMILSPVHICLIVTNEHFKTDLAHSIKTLFKPSIILVAFNLAAYCIIRMIFR